MATTLSVVTFATGPHKLQLLQPAHGKNNNNSETEIQRMDIKRKQPAIMVSPDSTATVVITNGSYSHGTTVTTPNTTTSASLKLRRRTTPTPSGFTGQQPVSVARRNARERNRVKQVNNGFATLRQHIPYTSRNKKMSKVETLRCAVEYIRSLKQLLDENDTNVSSSGEESDNAILQQAGVVFQHDTVSDSASEPQFVPDEFKDGFDEPMLPATSRSYLTMQDRLPSLVTAFSAQELTLVGTSNSLSPTYSDTSSNNSSCPPEAPGYLAVFGSKSGAVDLQPLRHQSVKNEVTKDDDGVLDVMTWWDPRSSLRQVTTS